MRFSARFPQAFVDRGHVARLFMRMRIDRFMPMRIISPCRRDEARRKGRDGMAPLTEQGRQVVRQLRLLADSRVELLALADELEREDSDGSALLTNAPAAAKAALGGLLLATQQSDGFTSLTSSMVLAQLFAQVKAEIDREA